MVWKNKVKKITRVGGGTIRSWKNMREKTGDIEDQFGKTSIWLIQVSEREIEEIIRTNSLRQLSRDEGHQTLD